MNHPFLPLLFAILFSAASAYAGEWEYDASGSVTGLYGYSEPDSKYTKENSRNHGTGDADLSVYAKYIFNNEYEAGIYADLMFGVDHELEDYNQGKWGEEVYGIMDSPYGRLMLGQTLNVAAQFHNGAPSVGPLGIENSDIVDFIANPNWKRKNRYARFATLNTTYINTDGVAPKISYISPEYYNTMLGLTYVPETYNRRGLVNKDAAYYDKGGYIISLYNHLDLDFVDVTTSLGYADFVDNDQEYSASLNLSRGNWSLGGGWRRTNADGKNPVNHRVSDNTPEWFDGYRDGEAWDVGVGYEIGPYKVSLSYFKSKAEKSANKDEIVMLSNQYQVNKYLDVYLSAAHVDFSGANANLDENNKGYAFVTGLSLKF